MGLNVISNFAANVAHRNLVKSDMEATQSLAKLSSGTRVVSAKDDAASMAIGSRLSAEVQSLRQATVNAGQAVSMLQIADGAMSQVNEILIRMKTLSVQAASGQISDVERGMLDTEFQSLLDEVDRISSDTEFNGTLLVAGSTTVDTAINGIADATDNQLQAADGVQSIEFNPAVGDAAMILDYDASTGVVTMTNLTTGESQGLDINSASAIPGNQEQSIAFDNLGATVTLNSAFDKSADINADGGTYSAVGGEDILGSSVRLVSATGSGGQSLTTNVMSIDATAANSATLTIGGFSETGIDLSATGAKTATFTDGTDTFTIEFTVTTAFSNTDDGGLELDGLGAMVFGDSNTGAGASTFTFKLGTGTQASVDNVSFSVSSIDVNALGLLGSAVNNQVNAEGATGLLNSAIDNLNVSRAEIGANQNRIEFASANLRIAIENAEAARSDILDLDVAQEMSTFTSKQVLLQAGVSMLAQANQMPQNLLQLLQG